MKRALKTFVISTMLLIAALTVQVSVYASGEVLNEKEIYNQDGLVITVKGLEEDWLGPKINMLFENNSDRPLGIQADFLSINDIMVTNMMSVELEPGKKANDAMSLIDVEKKGIDTIANIEFSFRIFDPNTYEMISKSERISLTTENNENYVQEYDSSGNVLYDNNGILIVEKGLNEEDIFGKEMLLYLENNTENDVVIQADKVSVNGFMMYGMMSVDLPAGKHAYDGLTLMESDFEGNSIDKIENIELSFVISDMNTFMTIEETDSVSIDVE